MSRAVLLDAAPGLLDARDDDTVITLSAIAEYACRRSGIPHHDVSTYALESRLAELQDRYWLEQLRWLDDLEQSLLAVSSTLQRSGLRPIAAAGYLLKLQLDNVFVKAYYSDALTDGPWTEIVHRVRGDGPSLMEEVLPRFAAARSVAYERRVATLPTQASLWSYPRDLAYRTLVPVWRRLRLASMAASSLSLRRWTGPTLLLFSSRYDLADLLRENRRRGGAFFVVLENRVLDLGLVLPRTSTLVPSPDEDEIAEWREVASHVRDDEQLRRWPRSWFSGEAEGLVMERLAAWVAEFMPRVAAASRAFSGFLRSEKVDAVVVPFIVEATEIAAVATARATGLGGQSSLSTETRRISRQVGTSTFLRPMSCWRRPGNWRTTSARGRVPTMSRLTSPLPPTVGADMRA